MYRMKFLSFLSVASIAVLNLTVLGAPTPGSQPPQKAPYFLRVVSPKLPWHHRHVVHLPNGLLGLENFTVHPQTPPIPVLPIQIPGQYTYALQQLYGGDDLSKTPYIAAFLSNTETAPTASFGTIFVPDPTCETLELNPSACPVGNNCVADAFFMYAVTEGRKADTEKEAWYSETRSTLGLLAYGGFLGGWEAVKDTENGDGWYLYWRPLGDDYHEVPRGSSIEIEVVSMR